MGSITVTYARQNLYSLIKEVNENAEAVTVVNSRGKNAVIMSEEEYENIKETLFFMENPVMDKILTEARQTPRSEMIEFDGWKDV